MKGVLPWLVRWARRASIIDFCPDLPALVGPVQNIFFLTIHYFTSSCPHRPVRWTGSRDVSPVSEHSMCLCSLYADSGLSSLPVFLSVCLSICLIFLRNTFFLHGSRSNNQTDQEVERKGLEGEGLLELKEMRD
jgi:hypothetical protein